MDLTGDLLTFSVAYFDPKKVEELKAKSKPSCPQVHEFLQGILNNTYISSSMALYYSQKNVQ